MPLYEYKCTECDHVFEVLSSVSDRDAPRTCPACGHTETKKQVSQTSFALKGGGWASDGYSG